MREPICDHAQDCNSNLDGNARRVIGIREGERVNQKAFRNLIRAAVALHLEPQKP